MSEQPGEDEITEADLEALGDADAIQDVMDGDEDSFPQPRAAAMRGKMLQVGRPKVKKPGKRQGPAKGGGRIRAREKQRQALELRKAGASYQQIAEAVGYADASGAAKATKRAFDQIVQEPAAEVRMIQYERLNHMLVTLWPKVQAGDERAIQTSLNVMDKMDRLMGTDAPTEVSHKHEHGVLVIEGDKDGYINALKRMGGMVDTNGHTMTATQQTALPPPPQVAVAGPDQPMDISQDDGDVVDAELVDEPADTYVQPDDQTLPAMPTKKKFSFGVEPTVRRP